MQLKEVHSKLLELEIPVAYMALDESESECPAQYVVYYESGTDIRGGDYINLINDMTVKVELYSDHKDTALEERLENLFSEYDLSKDCTYIDDEKMHETIYEFNVINKRS